MAMKLLYDKENNILTTGRKYTYDQLTNNIDEYCKLLEPYYSNNLSCVGVIVKDDINFDTMSLINALLRLNIVPVIINEEFGEQTKGILEKENITVAFYEAKKPKYLNRCDVAINPSDEDKWYVSVNPYMNIKNKRKIKWLNCYIKLFDSDKQNDCVCKLYDKVELNVVEEVITRENIKNYNKNFDELANCGEHEKVQTTLPLYRKQGFLYMMSAVSNKMNMICLNKYDMEKNINIILKEKPSVITIDTNIMLELIINDKFKNIDLSFVKKVVVDVEPHNYPLVFEILERSNFNGSYMTYNSPYEHEKVKNL